MRKFVTCLKGEEITIPVQAVNPDSDCQSRGWTLGSPPYDGVVISLTPGEWMDQGIFITLDRLETIVSEIKVKRFETNQKENLKE